MSFESNPLIFPILDVLKETFQPVSEYELIGLLKVQLDNLIDINSPAKLSLFKEHFLVMNALYQLQVMLEKDSIFLFISPLRIMLRDIADSSKTKIIKADIENTLKSYYLDWSNLEDTGEQEVDRLLNRFWQCYADEDKQSIALQTLNLRPDTEWAMIKKSYRRLAAEKHPDRGGVTEEFIKIREAYELLKGCYKK
jgi:hypothetical protein